MIQTVAGTEMSIMLQKIRGLAIRGLVDPALGTIPKQAQLLVELCMGLTPPRANTDKLTGAKISPTHKAAGESAVARDINFIIKARNPGYLESVIQITGKTENVRHALTNKKGVTYLIDVDRINEDGSEIPTWHAKHRDARGRVRGSTSKSNDTVIGRWTARNRLWVMPGSLHAYVKKKQALVGHAKAGWLKAYLALGGKRIADWVARQGSASGTFVDGLSSARPYVAAYNNTGWGRGPDSERIVENAMQARAKAMASYYNTTMRLAAEGKPTRWQAQVAAEAAKQSADN